MKFNMQLSTDDILNHKEQLEELYSTTADGVRKTDSADVLKCMEIFNRTFLCNETCPKCGKGVLKPNHLSSYYNMIIKTCDSCSYVVNLSKKPV